MGPAVYQASRRVRKCGNVRSFRDSATRTAGGGLRWQDGTAAAALPERSCCAAHAALKRSPTSSFDWPASSLGQPVRSLLPRPSSPPHLSQSRLRQQPQGCCRARKAALRSLFGVLNPSQMLPWGTNGRGWVGGRGLHPSYIAWRQGTDTCLPSPPSQPSPSSLLLSLAGQI